MKIFSLMKIGHRHVASRKRQSLLSVVTIGILYGVLISILFLLEGAEDDFIQSSNLISGNKIYTTVSSCRSINNCLSWEAIEPLARRKASSYDGEIVSKLRVYNYKNGGASFKVIDEEYVKDVIGINLNEFPRGTLFKIISLDEAEEIANLDESSSYEEETYISTKKTYSIEEIEDLKSKLLGREFTEVYKVPTSSLAEEPLLEVDSDLAEISEMKYEDKPVKYVVAGIIGTERTPTEISEGYGDIRFLDLLLSLTSNKVIEENLFISRLNDNTINYQEIFEASTEDNSMPIVEFKKLKDAYDFYANENCELERNQGKCSSNFTVEELVGNRLQSQNALKSLYRFLGYDEVALILVAVTIAVFTFIRLVGENARSIALYRSIGASSSDILLIYLFYLLELCFFATIFSFLLGLAIAVAISVKDIEVLSNMFTSIFARKITSGLLIGFSPEMITIAISIFLTAPLCTLLTLDQLSTKNIAKKIKSE